MSMVHRGTGRTNSNKPNKADTNSNVTKNVKTETVVKIIEKEKKQPTPEQMRLASLTDRGEMQNTDNIPDKIIKIVEFTHKAEDEVLLALHDCGYNEQEAITYLLEGKAQGWSDPVTKKKKSRTASASKNDAEANNGDVHENNADWDKEANTSSNHHGERSNRGFRGARRDRGGRRDDRGSFHDRKWKGRENKENERHNEEGVSVRDYRGRGDRLTNGPSRMGRGGRGSRGGGRGPGGSRTFQSRDGNDRGGGGGGFPRQIDTWNNPETENATSKADEFPSPEDWDNEEYTGSLADTKVFTPSTAVEPETTDTTAPVETEIKDESIPMHMNIQSQPNAPIPSMVVGSNQLTPAQTQYFNQLAAQGKQTQQQSVPPTQPKSQVQQPSTSVIYNSSITSPQQGFVAATTQASSFASGASQSYASVTPSQSFTAMVSSQTFQQSPPVVSYQSPSTMSGSVSYSRTNSEYTSPNYSDVISNYNSMVGLQTNGALPQRNKPQRPTSRQETPTKVIPGNVDIPSADGSMNSAMKYLDAQFSAALDFNNAADNYDSSTTTNDQGSVAALSNKFGQTVSGSATPHSDLTAINTFQATQSKQSHSSTNISSVLNQTNKLPCESAALQNGSSVYSYSSQTNTNSLSVPSVGGGGGGGGGGGTDVVPSLSYGIGETYQTQLQTSNAASSSVSSYHPSVVGTSITSTASNVYSNQQTQQTQQQPTSQVSQPQPQQQQSQTQQQAPPQPQQQAQQPQQQSQISSGVTYTTNNTSTSFSVYSSNNHSVATATPPLHNSVYHNSSYQPHPSVTASFQSYMSYPSSIIQPYQAGAAGLTQTPYLGTAQYGGGSLPSLGATYGAAFHNNYGVNSGLQTPVATLQQNHKMSNSLSTNASSKDSQYDGLQAITSVSGSSNSATTTTGSVMSGLSQAPTTTSSKVSSSSSAGSKSAGMLPSIPPGVTPLLGPAGPQYIMSQPLYQPAFSLNYDELQYLPRGIPHMPAAYLDLNYATAQQTNLATTGREALNVPFSSISDGRYTRPDNTTSPVPPSGATAGASLSQQNTAPTHQQQHVPMLQTYATAYIYPPYQQYTAPVYQVAPTATPTAPGASTNAISGTPFGKAPAGYNSTGYTSQYDSLSSNQSSGADYSGKGSSSNAYSSNQQPSKSSGGSGTVSGQSSNVNSADLSMYGKSHASLTKNYDNKSFHSGTPPPFTMTGSGSTSSNVGNLSSVGGAATGYGPQLYIPNVPTAAATAAHHLHQNSHHQDGADMRSSGTSDRNFFLSSNRPSYR